MHIYGACVLIYSDSFLKSEKLVAFILVGMYCATFGLCILLLATHFVYRYFAICRPQNIHHFRGSNLFRVYSIPVFFSALWFTSVTILMAPTQLKSQYMRNSINETYQEDTLEVGYIALLYYYASSSGNLVISYQDVLAAVVPGVVMYTDKTGNFVVCWGDFISAFFTCGIMEVCIGTMAFCGWKTYWTLRRARDSMSAKTKELNNQLFKTLIIQTLVPICTLFTPVGSLIILPMFSVGVGKLANAPSFYAGFYPAVDALIIIFMIRDFRETVL
ncbi:hypothetical protein CAEBREN_28474, partial [Caenorhabditis brenneri]